jgi:hypothetical protein
MKKKRESIYTTKVAANGNMYQCITGVVIDSVQFLATDKCRKQYNQGNPVRTLKLYLN